MAPTDVDQYLTLAAEPAHDHTPQHASPEPDESAPNPQYEQSNWFTPGGQGQKYGPDQADPTMPIVLDPSPTNTAVRGGSPYFGGKPQQHFHDQDPEEPLELDLETTQDDSLGEHSNVGLDLKGTRTRSHRKSAMIAEQKAGRPERRSGRLRRVARSVGYMIGIASTTTGIMIILDGISTRGAY